MIERTPGTQSLHIPLGLPFLLLVTLFATSADAMTILRDSALDPSYVTSTKHGSSGRFVGAWARPAGRYGEYDRYLRVDMVAPLFSGATQVHHLVEGMVYDPSAMGAIERIDWSIDARSIEEFQIVTLAARQDGNTFMALAGVLSSLGSNDWQVLGSTGLNETDFWQPGTVAGLGPKLDLSSTGSPIQFGFWTSRSAHVRGARNNSAVGYDELVVTLHPVPEPGTAILLGLGIGLLALRQTRR